MCNIFFLFIMYITLNLILVKKNVRCDKMLPVKLCLTMWFGVCREKMEMHYRKVLLVKRAMQVNQVLKVIGEIGVLQAFQVPIYLESGHTEFLE